MAREDSRTRVVRVEVIRSLMDQLNISKSKLAKQARLTLKQVNNILSKKNNPREDTIVRIATVLGVRWRTLLEVHEGPPEETGEGGVSVAMMTVDLIIETSDDMAPEELQRRLEAALRKLGPNRMMAADIIRIVKLRTENEV
jgi:transcriptional regulator with XRE-family HTH domain